MAGDGGAEEGEAVATRSVTDDDESFLRAVYASTRAAELALVDWDDTMKEAFVRQQFDAQRDWYGRVFPGGTRQVILVGGQPAGRLYLDLRPEETRIVDIALLPEFQGRGAGSSLLARILGDAALRRACVSLHVERDNPALAWYRQRGFTVEADEGRYLLLRWRPPTSPPATP